MPLRAARTGTRTAAATLAGTLAATLTATLLAGCTLGGSSDPGPAPAAGATTAVDAPALDAALSTPVEDRVYPRVGDPGVDALHYGLALAWSPRQRRLTATESLVLRATRDAPQVRLDLSPALEVGSVAVDGREAAYSHDGKDLVVRTPVREDERHTLAITYAGTPQPVQAPTTRTDIERLGWTTTDRGDVWTMQEPYGAYTWYAVNDQPSDKALYDITVSAPAPLVGVANGTLTSRRTTDGTTTTRWHLDEPASSYLVTVAIGDYTSTTDDSGPMPLTYWTPADQPRLLDRLRAAPAGLAWLEKRLGPYPFGSLGFVLVDSRSGMETQTMITLGTTDYATSPEVLVHEMAHQWWGDEVTPTDWRDVWMSEGMALYLQGVWQAQHSGEGLESLMDYWAAFEPSLRRESGPPADYDPRTFGEGNVYYGPALMWDELRERLGDREFWSLVRAWPRSQDDANASYDDVVAWWSQRTGRDLRPFFDAWLLGRTSPPRG